jgi:tetratricopeptide (TPR) repeat protein
MSTEIELKKSAEEGKLAFEAGQYQKAADLFERTADGYASLNDEVNAAEMKNNLSVALLKTGRAQAAFDAALGTEKIFAHARDLRRQGMSMGNQAAALEALKRFDEALIAYEQSAKLFADAGEGDLRAMVLKAAAGIKLKRGQVTDSAFKMIGSLEARDKPSIFERTLKALLRFMQR